jgi:AcrR family transcriptional regulator
VWVPTQRDGNSHKITEAQQRLLDAAVEVFAAQGFGGTSTRDIAARAGRSPAADYVHHPTKEDLLFAISERGHRDALECLQAAYDGSSDPVERLHEMVRLFSLWHLENVRLARVVQYELNALTPEHRVEIVGLRREFHRLVCAALRAGLRDGVFAVDDVPRAAHSLLSLGIDLVRWFDPDLEPDVTRIANHNAELAVRMVGMPSRPPLRPR